LAADDIQKNKPARRDVEQILEEIGGAHNPEKMKVSPLGSVETDSTYYHVFYGSLKKGGYHLIFFDNTPAYLGYYLISLEPTGYGEGEIYLYLTSNSTITIPIGDEGPPEKLRMGDTGMQAARFIMAPVKEEPEEEAAVSSKGQAAVKAKKKPEYRSWNITKDGKVINVPSAIFIEMKDGNIALKNGKNGSMATVPAKSLSAADKDYLQDLLQ
jgi:hypothetical protein